MEAGVINAHVTQRVAPAGHFYAPDPSSQSACTIGGNVAENSGGAHCLKYGFTTNHVLELEVVLPNGELVHLGSPTLDAPGYDLAGVFVGSEGTLGVASSMTLRIVRRPETVQVLLAAFDSISAAGQTVSDIIAASILPAAMEIMDRLPIQAAEAAVHPHYPGCEALLLVELDGPAAEVDLHMQQVRELCKNNGAWEDRLAQSEQERMLVWKGRKAAFAAAGPPFPRLHRAGWGDPAHQAAYRAGADCGDGGSRRTAGLAMCFMRAMATCIRWCLYDRSIPGQEEIAIDLSMRILHLCVDHGGSITGEHGVGREKQQALGYMYSEPDLDTMQRVRCSFDPDNIANPDKVFPRPRLCGEKTGKYTPHPLETAGVAEFF